MTPDDRRELERLLNEYGIALLELERCHPPDRKYFGETALEERQNLIAFVDRLTNSPLREALDVAVKGLELTSNERFKQWEAVDLRKISRQALDQIQAILKGDRLTEKGEK